MGILGGETGNRLLRSMWPAPIDNLSGKAYARREKLKALFGEDVYDQLRGKVVVDFGCGEGFEAVRIAQNGAQRVIGVDMQSRLLELGREHARKAGVTDRCVFTEATSQKCDIVLSLDSFEHFEDPAAVLSIMRSLLKPGGYIWTSFGPTWYHRTGGTCFSHFPGLT